VQLDPWKERRSVDNLVLLMVFQRVEQKVDWWDLAKVGYWASH
jgi:hypothetical protein